ncbi:MAG: DNA gyrase/topoisomerase IV subunit A, partial [Bacteroidia bacterium]|nr:DNA gyrase/topoisomerase IV subunit A [Bacteroidia bacterium]
ERKTEIKLFDKIETNVVAVANQKLFANKAEGFVGYSMKKDDQTEYICDCSDIDDIIAFRSDGTYLVSKASEKQFMGKDLIYVDIYRKNDERKVYNAVYFDGKSRVSFVKRFNVLGVIRDKEYDLTQATPNSKVLYFTANNNSEAEKIHILLSSMSSAKVKSLEYDFTDLAIKGKTSKGNVLTKHPIRKIELKEKGKSTYKGRDLWYEHEISRLNVDGRGQYLGVFASDDLILVISADGSYELTNNELSNRYEGSPIMLIQKYHPGQPISAIHYDSSSRHYFAKRFIIETTTQNKKFIFINEKPSSKLLVVSTHENPEVELITVNSKKDKITENIRLADFIEIKGWKAIGNKITFDNFKSAKLLSPVVGEWEEEETEEEVEEVVIEDAKKPSAVLKSGIEKTDKKANDSDNRSKPFVDENLDELDGQKKLF